MGKKGSSNLKVVSTGPNYTKLGENVTLIQQKGIAFQDSWGYFREHGLTGLQKPLSVRVDEAWNQVYTLYSDPAYAIKLKYARVLSDAGLDLLNCTEDEVRATLDKYIRDETRARRQQYLKEIASDVRGMFRCIGRENMYGEGQVYQSGGFILMNSGNPMTTASEEALVARLIERVGRAVATDPQTLGHPISVVGGIMTMIYHLSKLITMMTRWAFGDLKQVERIANLANLVLMYAFMMHEAGRPGEFLKHLEHTHLYFPLHQKVYWLTLVIIRPDTLKYLLVNDKITHYALSPFKSKQAQIFQPRLKAVIPHAYNSIDLVMIYIICMRCILALMPSQFGLKVFKHHSNFSGYQSDRNEELDQEGLTFYSFRRAAAEEDKKFKITGWWTKMRMGHSDASTQKNQYARNQGNRVKAFGEALKLGCDVRDEPVSTKQIKLEYVPLGASGCVYDTEWLTNTFDDAPLAMRQDFVDATKIVDEFMASTDSSSLVDYVEKQFVVSSEEWKEERVRDLNFTEWREQIPLGFHYKFPGEMCQKNLTAKYDDAKSHLEVSFAEVAVPRFIPEIYSFCLIIYGNLRYLVDKVAKATCDLLSKPIVVDEPQGEPQDEAGPSNAAADAAICSSDGSAGSRDSHESWDDGVDLSQIKVGNYVVIVCDDPRDVCALRIPNMHEKWVFIGKVTKLEGTVKTKKFASGKSSKVLDICARFMMNDAKDIRDPLKIKKGRAERMMIRETSVIDVYSDKHLDGRSLTADNIEFIETFLKAHT